MFNRVLLFILLITTSSFGATIYTRIVDPIGVLSSTWDSTAGTTKIVSLTDASDGTYIWTTVNEADSFRVAAPSMLWYDLMDSIKIFWRGQRVLIGTASVTAKLHSPDGTLTGTTRALTTTLTDYTESFSNITGFDYFNIGDWDLTFTSSSMSLDTAKVMVCSVGVYITRQTIFYFTNAEGCVSGDNFGKTMEEFGAISVDTQKIVVPANTTENDYFSTTFGIPNNIKFENGADTIFLDIEKNVNPCSLQVRILQTNSSCVAVDSSSFSTKQTLSGLGPQIQQTLDPDANPSPSQWDSTATGTKLSSITDATDANYIFSPVSTVDTDAFALQDFTLSTYEFGDVIDSLKLFIRAQKVGIPATTFLPQILIGSDVLSGSSIGLTTSWVGYTRVFTVPPGSRGTWDAWELDSTKVRFVTDEVHGEARITQCSTVVYITKQFTKIAIPPRSWPTLSTSNRMSLHFRWTNPSGAAEDTIWFLVGSGSPSRLETDISNNGAVAPPQAGCATQDSILAADAVTGFNQWDNFGGASKVASITDAVDANYIFEVTNAQAQQFFFANQGIPANAIIDSIKVESRAQRTSGGPTTRFLHRIMKDSVTTQYCDGTQKTLTTSWVAYADGFKGFVSGGGACNNLFTRARLDSLNVRFIKNTGNEVRVTRSVIYICYTVPSACEFTLNDANSAIDDAMLNVSLPTTNFGTYGFLDIWDINTTLGQRQSVIKWDVLKDSIVNRTVASATLRFNPEASTATTMMTYIRGLRRAWTESEVTWDNATTAVAWATAGAGDASTDRYSDILDSFVIADTNSSGWTELNVTSYLQLCDGTDTTNYKGWILTPKQNSGINTYWSGASSEHTAQILSPQLTVNYCTAGAPSTKRRRRIIMSSVDEIETRGAGEFAKLGDFSAEPIIGFTDNSWLWGEDKEWTVNPRVRFEIIDSEEEK